MNTSSTCTPLPSIGEESFPRQTYNGTALKLYYSSNSNLAVVRSRGIKRFFFISARFDSYFYLTNMLILSYNNRVGRKVDLIP